ncbi:MAG TPA: hypothetical protein VHO06_12540 [Polyangia bacterium]|nr:hypothetical protein [Polyangia bacterium]
MSTDGKKRFPFTEDGIKALGEKLRQPELDDGVTVAVPLLAELSGLPESWWAEAMKTAAFWREHVNAGATFDDPAWFRAQGTGLLADVMLAHLGKIPPAELVREFDRRLRTFRTVRNDGDEVRIADEDVEHYWRAWTAIRKVVSSARPDGVRE